MRSWVLGGVGAVISIVACSSTSDGGATCGAGTRLQGNECVVAAGGGGTGTGASAGTGGADANAGTAGAGAGAGSGGTGASAGTGGSGTGGSTAGGSGGAAGSGDSNSAGEGGDGPGPVLITSPLDCGSRDVTGATVITDPISQDTTWSGVVHLPNGLSVHAEPTITIQPGTKIIVGHGGLVEFGYQGSHATVRALGTPDQPIKFCGETDTRGYFAGVVFRSGVKPESILRNVLITDGGGTDADLTLEMGLVVQGVQLRNSGTNGVKAAAFGPDSSTLIVAGATKSSVLASAASGLAVPPASVLTGNGLDSIDIGFTTFDADATFVDRGVPYRLLATTTGSSSTPPPLITIEPGVDIHIPARTTLEFGKATVHALGTSNKPILFRGLPCLQASQLDCPYPQTADQYGRGGRVALSNGSGHQLKYVELRSLGWTIQSEYPPFTVTPYDALTVATEAQLSVGHLKLMAAFGYGAQFSGKGGFSPDSAGIASDVTSSSAPALSLDCATLFSLPKDTVITTSSQTISSFAQGTKVTCGGTALTGTWPTEAAGPYSLNDFYVESGANITVPAGTVLRFAKGARLIVEANGRLTVSGTGAANVQFVHDITQGGSDNWTGIIAQAGSTTSLDYVTVDHAGDTTYAGAYGAAVAALGPITLTHSSISYSASWGLKKTAADTTDYVTGNSFTGNAAGTVTNLP